MSLTDVETHPRLLEAVTEALKGERLPVEEAVTRFRDLRELALALAVSRRQPLSFARLCEAMATARALPEALRRVAPRMDIRAEMNGARPDAQALLGRGAP